MSELPARRLHIHNLSEIATPVGEGSLAGHDQGAKVRRIAEGEVLCEGGSIVFAGAAQERRKRFRDLSDWEPIDGGGGTLIPGLIDCHTHLPWAGSRANELVARLQGKSYLEIAAEGGGILATVAATREATEAELTALVSQRLDRMLLWGTTTAEAKSGYGLNVDDELKQLRAIHAAGGDHPIELAATLMAAHQIPPEYKDDRRAFVDLVVKEITRAAASEGLAEFCDVFCEQGVFTVEEARRVLTAGQAHGLIPRLHADEFVDSGGATLAAELGAASADHLVAPSEAGIAAMAAADPKVTAVLLPGVSFFLRHQQAAPARRLIEAGVPVALATDCNPGSSHTESLPFIFWLGVFRLGMTIEEALTAVTLNPACVLQRGKKIGSIEEGKQADLVLLDAPDLNHLAYHFGVNPVRTVIKRGEVAVRDGIRQR